MQFTMKTEICQQKISQTHKKKTFAEDLYHLCNTFFFLLKQPLLQQEMVFMVFIDQNVTIFYFAENPLNQRVWRTKAECSEVYSPEMSRTCESNHHHLQFKDDLLFLVQPFYFGSFSFLSCPLLKQVNGLTLAV